MAFTRNRLATLGVAGVLTAGAAVSAVTPAIARDVTQAPSAQAETRGQAHEERRAAFATALAAELDLPVDRVRAALDSVHERFRAGARERRLANLKERLDAAVAAGTLTQEQADAIHAAAEAGVMPFGGPGGKGGRGGHHCGGFHPGPGEPGDGGGAEPAAA